MYSQIGVDLKPKNKNIEKKIGTLIFKAYDKRDKAIQIEDEAKNLLQKKIKELAQGKR